MCVLTEKRPDVLRDAAGLCGRHLALPQTVQQGGLPVIHVPHDGNHRGAWHQAGWVGRRSGWVRGQISLLQVTASACVGCDWLTYLGRASRLGLSLLALSLAQRNFIPDRVTASLIQRSSRTECGSRVSRSTVVLSSASSTWSKQEQNII